MSASTQNSTGTVYLAKLGKIYGPFSSQELFDLQASGRIQEYSWLWDDQRREWKAIDPAPKHGPHDQVGLPTAQSSVDFQLHSVICHNFKSLLRGDLAALTETGCVFTVHENMSTPKLSVQGKIVLNLLIEGQTHTSLNISAQVCGIEKTHRGWNYRLRWDEAPQATLSA